jgi:hypothetical protein
LLRTIQYLSFFVSGKWGTKVAPLFRISKCFGLINLRMLKLPKFNRVTLFSAFQF